MADDVDSGRYGAAADGWMEIRDNTVCVSPGRFQPLNFRFPETSLQPPTQDRRSLLRLRG